MAKYEANPEAKEVLLGTGEKRLIEFSRGAARVGADEKWAGIMKDGVLHGSNWMGEMHEYVRKQLKEKKVKENEKGEEEEKK
jgi:predicted NAD-dependent protein-ADP-ribosyltransferase YbiA (DUF1768 family)